MYAPKIKELGHFELMPNIFWTSCSVAAEAGNAQDCEISQGWFLNNW